MSGPDEIVHQTTRLKILSALNALPRREKLEFVRLKAITGATDGNLGAHLTTLEKAGYVAIVKDFVGKKPRTRAGITGAGRRAFRDHVDYLRDILDDDGGGA
ncbi:MAG: transcriptional regulator [Rhodospirillaceae bacterium]|nr:transcriptional regulator [Rhodospirillaceae bacterium]